MNSAVKQLPRSFARAVGRWTSLLCVLLALPALGQGYSVTQPGTITINDALFQLGQNIPKPATPYPGSIVTSNLLGTIQKVAITLNGLSHTYAADIDALLVREDLATNIVLFSDVALNFPFNGINLTIDDTADASLPISGSVTSGSYKATNLNGGDSDVYDSPAPATAANSLGQLAGKSPNGTWKLFLMDDKASDIGSASAWTVTLFTTPIFTQVPASITNNEDATFSTVIKVNDSDTPLDQLVLSATSSDTNIVANQAFSFSGTGTDRTLSFTPKSNQNGTITVTLKLEDAISKGGSAITTNFTVVINPVNDGPTITLNTNAVTTLAATVTTNQLFAVVNDIDVPTQPLTLFARSSNTNVVMDDAVIFTAGTGGTNIFTIAPKGGATGTATVSINVTDGSITNSTSILVTVNPARQTIYGNPNPITIADNGVAGLYPSALVVSNVVGNVGKVRVTLADVNSNRPEDLDVLLVGPGGQKVALMGQAGGGNAITHGRITFDDSASTDIPDSSAITTGAYRPKDYGTGDLTAPAPAGPYDTTLSSFAGSTANGTWSLYVVDRVSAEGVDIKGGWVLEIFQAPKITGLPATVRTGEDTNVTVQIVITDADGFPNAVLVQPFVSGFVGVTATPLTNQNVTLTFDPVDNVFGTNNVRVVAVDNEGYSSTNTFSLEIFSVNDTPTISPVAKQITYAGIPVQGVTFTVGDVESAVSSLTVTGRSDNTSLLPDVNVVVEGTGATRTVSLYPVGATSGTATVTLTVSDGSASSTSSFVLEVLQPASPLYSNRSAIVINDSGVAGQAAAAALYPSVITVPALKGKVQKVKVTLLGLSHPRPEDLDILLVGPNNNQVIIASDAGGSTAANNVQLLLEDAASSLLPNGTALASGTFKPTNLANGPADTFPGAPSPASTSALLDSFAGLDLSGGSSDWKLYVVDDDGNNSRGGTLAGGWMINFVTSPQITAIADQTTTEDTAKRVAIVIGDEQPGVQVLLEADSSNRSLVGTNSTSMFFEGTGANRTLVINPTADQAGTSTITVRATINGVTTSDDFVLTVTAVDDSPIIAGLSGTKDVPAGLIAGPYTFSVTDKETADANTMPSPTATSSDQSVVPDANIKIVRDPGTPSGTNWLLTVVPNGTTSGSADITITAKDPTNQRGQANFTLRYTRNLAYANTGRISIQDNAVANPYPSTINVSGVNGLVSRATVTLRGLTHAFPDDVAVLLVAPDASKKVVLMSNIGGGAPTNSLSGVTLTFDDSGTVLATGEEKLADGTYHPTSFGISTANGSFPSSAPAKDYQTAMSSFNGINPNGDWQLYVFDDTFSDAGSIENGWILILETAPSILSIANQTTPEDVTLAVPIFVNDQDTNPDKLTTWAITSAQVPSGLINDTNLVITPTNAYQRTLTITPTPNLSGTNLIEVFVTDGRTTNSTKFGLTVSAVDDPPLVSTSTNRIVINEDTSTNITFAISDIDSVLSITNASVTSGNTILVTNLVLTGPISVPSNTTSNLSLAITPNANQNGEAVISLSMRDGTTTVVSNVLLVVNPVNDAPTITGLIASTNVNVGESRRDIPFKVGDIETSSRNLTVTATSSDTSIIPNSNIVLGGANDDRLLSFTTIGNTTNNVTITVTVSDGNLSASAAMVVAVTSPPRGRLFTSSTPITIRDANKADVYPSTIAVSGLNGAIHRLSVTLEGFAHTAPDDVDVLLVSPTGKKIVLLGDAGGRIAVTNARVVIEDTASNLPVPDDGPLTAGSYKPSNYSPEDSFVDIAAPYDGRLSDLVGTNPNGDWKLYVVDDTTGDVGAITQGWALNILTAPTITLGTPTITQNEDTAATATVTVADKDSPSTTHDQLVVSVASSNPTVIPPGGISFTTTSTNVVGLLQEYVKNATFLPGTNQPSDSIRTTNTITVTVRRTTDDASASAAITSIVAPINDRPIISRITEKTTSENTPITVSFLVTDVDTLPRDLSIQATNNGSALVAMSGLKFYGAGSSVDSLPGNEVQLTIIPNNGATGSLPITIRVTDKSTLAPSESETTTFTLNIETFNDAPTISSIADVGVDAGSATAAIPFVVTDQENSTLRVTATSSDQNLVKNSNIVISPVESTSTNRTVTVTSEIGVTGSAQITLTVSDGSKTSTTSFNVRVLESRERTYTNNRRLVINDNAGGSDYPSVINVAGLVGDVSQVKVGLLGLAHGFPDDIDVLLVGPGGQKVLLLSDAGGGTPITNVNLLISDNGAGFVPDSTAITTGTFKPSNYDTATDPFPSPAPAPEYKTALSEFIGTPANGDWKLYIVDDTASDAGVLNGGWTLYITTKPRISGLADVTVKEEQPFEIPFTIVEETFVEPTFTFRTSTTVPALIRTNDLSISGSGTNWVIRGTPVANASGTNQVTVFANNGRQEVSASFKVVVLSVNDAPTITDVADQTIFAGTRTAPIEFNYGDVETETKNIRLDIQTDNSRLIPTNNVYITGSTLVVAPVGNLAGLANITLTVTDGEGLSASTTFAVRVLPSLNPQFANSDRITIRDNQSADVYPSTVTVSGVSGNIARVSVTLAEVNHPFPSDVDILLVGPLGQKVVLMSDAGGSGRLINTRITIDDAGADQLPFNPSSPIASGTYKPSNYQGADVFASPAPAGPYEATLAPFIGTNPNGVWSLYVQDDASPDAGNIVGGWVLNIYTTNPTIGVIDDQTTDENVAITVPVQIQDADTAATNLVTAVTTDNTRLLNVALSGTGNTRSLTITPVEFANGEGNVTVSVTDGTGVAEVRFKVTVRPVDQAPLISGLADINTPANKTSRVNFSVFDRETEAASLVTGATISKPSLGTVSVTGTTADRVLNFVPSGELGQGFINVTVSDGSLTTTNIISVNVGAPYVLTVSSIADQTMTENQTRTVPFTVTGSVSGLITAVGSSDNSALVSAVTIGGSGTNYQATIVLVANQTGTARVTITASDDQLGVGTTTFNLTVQRGQRPPVIAPIAPQTTRPSIPAIVRLSVTDEDTDLAQLVYTWTTSDTNLVRNVVFGRGGDGAIIATVIVRANEGVATISITADDGANKATQAFPLTIIENPPVLAAIDDQTTTANVPAKVTLGVTDSDTPLSELVFSSTTSNPSVIAGVTFDTSSGLAVATINPVADATGVATVTIAVRDSKTTVTRTFAVLVNAALPSVLETPSVSVVNGVLTVTVTWQGGGELEWAPSAIGPWTGTGNTSGSFSEPASAAARVYRVKR